MRSQNNFDITSLSRDWYANVTQEFGATWGRLPQFQGDVTHMNFMRAQVCWLETDMQDISTRRQCVYSLGEKILNNPKSPLSDWWNFFGVESVSGKVADAVCTLYNDAPYREFTEGLVFPDEDESGKATDASKSSRTNMQEALTDLYEQYNVNLAFKTAYRYALFVNCVVLMPDFENKTILVLTPDMFRFLGPELWYAKYTYDDKGNQVLQYHAWDANEHKIVDTAGKIIERQPNPYGRIPATILKLNQTTELYGSGITECAEINVWQNLINYFTTKIGVFQSHSILVARNINKEELQDQNLGAGAVIVLEGTKIEGLDPSLEYITPQNFIEALESQKQKRVRQFIRDQGLPGFLVDEGAGQPPTGAALQVMERGLNEKRKEHSYALIKAEKDFADLLARGTNLHDTARSLAIGKFTIQYEDVETFDDPKAEFEYTEGLKERGLIGPAQYVRLYTNQRMTDEAAVEYMAKNKALFAGNIEPEVV